ncbi:MAG: succinyl-diaminopimelate desuccinylase [Pseudomonadota bacterium]
MDIHDPVSLAQALIRCPSVTPHEGGALTMLKNILEPGGFDVHRMTFTEPGTADVENLYARYGLHGPHLCFAGHVDVVPPGREDLWLHPPFAAVIDDGFLHGRGAADMKGAIACFVSAAVRIIERKGDLPGSLSFLITGDEEGPGINGTVKVLDWLQDRDERIAGCIVGEPTSSVQLGDTIKIGRRGSITVNLKVHGIQGHVAYPQNADNPVPKLVRILDRLVNTQLDNGSAAFEPSNLQVTLISVPNTASNVIPAEAHATFNVRYNDNWSRRAIQAWLDKRCHEEAEAADAAITIDFQGSGDVFLTKPGPLLNAMVAAVKEATGCTSELSTNGGTSDARFIQAYCPVIEFGLVNQTIHQVNERVAVADLYLLSQIYERLIEIYLYEN